MSQGTVIDVATRMLFVVLEVSMPILLATLVVGLIISLFQALTQIQEQTLTFIPKIIAVVAVLAFAGPWMLTTLVSYTQQLWESIPSLIGG
jgi:flagellar biosynthetic protein FliQ